MLKRLLFIFSAVSMIFATTAHAKVFSNVTQQGPSNQGIHQLVFKTQKTSPKKVTLHYYYGEGNDNFCVIKGEGLEAHMITDGDVLALDASALAATISNAHSCFFVHAKASGSTTDGTAFRLLWDENSNQYLGTTPERSVVYIY